MPYYKQDKKNKDGLTQYIVKVNVSDKQVKRTVYGLSAAKQLEKELLQGLQDKKLNTSSMTVADLFEDYNKNTKADIRNATLIRRQSVYNNYIAPYLADTQLRKLDSKTFAEWKNCVNTQNLSLTTRHNAFSCLKARLNYAVKMDYIAYNPMDKIDNFKDSYETKKEMLFYTPEEFAKYIAVAREYADLSGYYDYYVFFCIRYLCGLRKGEIHALRWNCIDGDNLSVKHSITQKNKNGDEETPPKNKSSIRTIKVPQNLQNILSDHKKRQMQMDNFSENSFVCGFYRPLRDTSIDNENRKYAEKRGVKRIRIHDFRHSHRSLLINENISPLEVAHRLGHSSVEQTLNTYAHLFPNEEMRAISCLNRVRF